MTRELVILITCDICGERGAEDSAKELSFSWQGKDYALDYCFAETDLASYTVESLMQKARIVKTEKRTSAKSITMNTKPVDPFFEQFLTKDGMYACPWTGCGQVLPTAPGVSTHFGRIHGSPVRDYMESRSKKRKNA